MLKQSRKFSYLVLPATLLILLAVVVIPVQACDSGCGECGCDCVCEYGCTLTAGYWKTHSRLGPAPYDATWETQETILLGVSGMTLLEVLWTPPAGNPYYQLSFQYIAARMNIFNGASFTPEVTSALSWAFNFFATTTPDTTFTKAQKKEIIYYKDILGMYNEGLIGPGHCPN